MSVWRYDRGEPLKPPRRLPNGYLRVDGYVTRTGVFVYRLPDGTTRRELRTPEEVFSSDALDSFEGLAITDEHPPEHLNADNTEQYSRGSVSGLKPDGIHVAGTLMVQNKALAKKVEDGQARELSCGYHCDLELKAGVHPVWGPYDAVQTNIRGNHLAIVPRGRAGPSASVRMDAADAVFVDDAEPPSRTGVTAPTPPKEQPMAKFTFDGVDYEGSEQMVQLAAKLSRKVTDAADATATAKTEWASEKVKLQATFDSMKADFEKAKAELAAATAPDAMRKRIDARLELERQCTPHLDEDDAAAVGTLDDNQLKRAVLAQLKPGIKLDGKSDEYVQVLFDIAIGDAVAPDDDEPAPAPARKDAAAKKKTLGNVRAAADTATRSRTRTDDDKDDADDARAEMLKANRELWKGSQQESA